MPKTLRWVSEMPNAHEGQHGTTYFVNVTFTDEEGGSIGSKTIERAEAHIDRLTKLIGVGADFGLEPKGEYNGHPQYKITSYPGWEPQAQAGSSPSSSDASPPRPARDEGFIQERMDRRTALVQAVEANSGVGGKALLSKASEFYAWLRETSSAPTREAVVSSPTAGAEDGTSAAGGEAAAEPQEAGEPQEASTGGAPASPADCEHPGDALSELNPSGKAMPKGYVFCRACRTALKGSI